MWHFGQRGASFKRSPGNLTSDSQCAQTTWTGSLMS
jgi:hypothetical protein